MKIRIRLPNSDTTLEFDLTELQSISTHCNLMVEHDIVEDNRYSDNYHLLGIPLLKRGKYSKCRIVVDLYGEISADFDRKQLKHNG